MSEILKELVDIYNIETKIIIDKKIKIDHTINEYKKLIQDEKNKKISLMNIHMKLKTKKHIKELKKFINILQYRKNNHNDNLKGLTNKLYDQCYSRLLFSPENKLHNEKMSVLLNSQHDNNNYSNYYLDDFKKHIINEVQIYLKKQNITL